MRERLFLDANVLFTATIFPEGVSRRILELAGANARELLTSSFAFDETLRNICARYPAH